MGDVDREDSHSCTDSGGSAERGGISDERTGSGGSTGGSAGSGGSGTGGSAGNGGSSTGGSGSGSSDGGSGRNSSAGKRASALLLLAAILILVSAAGLVFAVSALLSGKAGTDPASCLRGDRLIFGRYEQDNDMSDGPEAVEWIVLDRIGDEILLMSVCCLDYRPYNEAPFEEVTWEKSGIRRWLNEEFYSAAFSEEEKQLTAPRENRNDDHSTLGTEGGADTRDYVFLLSEKEAGIYMGDEVEREYLGAASATEYAAANGAWVDENLTTAWWLRTPGAYGYTAQFVETTGSLYTAGAYTDIPRGIRPAIWLDVSGQDTREGK